MSGARDAEKQPHLTLKCWGVWHDKCFMVDVDYCIATDRCKYLALV